MPTPKNDDELEVKKASVKTKSDDDIEVKKTTSKTKLKLPIDKEAHNKYR